MRINPDFDFRHLTAAARIQLAQDLWNSLTPEEVDAELPLTAGQKAELDRRLADLEQNPDAGMPWAQVRAELRAVLATVHSRGGAALDVAEREGEAERQAELLAMFNQAAEELTDDDREARRLFMQAHPDRD